MTDTTHFLRSPAALRAAAAALDREAKELSKQAERMEARRELIGNMVDGPRELSRDYATLINAGWSHDAALAELAAAHNLPNETIEYRLSENDDRQARLTKFQRDREIVRLARRGYTNKEIADRVGFKHANSVSRIIRAEFDKGRS